MKKVEFKLPPGVHLPEGVTEGGYFDVTAKLEAKSDGTVCIVEIDGAPMPGYDNAGDGGDDKPFSKRVMDGAGMYLPPAVAEG